MSNESPEDSADNLYVSSVAIPVGETVEVQDLDTAIYIYMRLREDPALRVKLLDAFKLGAGRHKVVFLDPKQVVRRLERDFTVDRAVLFASAQRDLKRFIRRRVDGHERFDKR